MGKTFEKKMCIRDRYAGGITSAAVDGIKVAEAVAAYINNIV